ncbi:MAG: zf-HC2 domain-containing protein [Lachnospiraceae bacterium]|nr:zf-HC2 domain-containing protein [Lachnospiraceae bacterium]
MNNRYDCNIILDLLPLSIEHMVSEETQQVIRAHMEECEDCRQIYEEMTKEIDIMAETGKYKRKRTRKHRYKKKNTVRMMIGGYLLLLLLIMAFCLIDICFF